MLAEVVGSLETMWNLVDVEPGWTGVVVVLGAEALMRILGQIEAGQFVIEDSGPEEG